MFYMVMVEAVKTWMAQNQAKDFAAVENECAHVS